MAMIDMLAHRYGLLPSEVMSRATTFDMVVMDMSLTYQNHLQNKNTEGYVPQYKTEDLVKLHRGT